MPDKDICMMVYIHPWNSGYTQFLLCLLMPSNQTICTRCCYDSWSAVSLWQKCWTALVLSYNYVFIFSITLLSFPSYRICKGAAALNGRLWQFFRIIVAIFPSSLQRFPALSCFNGAIHLKATYNENIFKSVALCYSGLGPLACSGFCPKIIRGMKTRTQTFLSTDKAGDQLSDHEQDASSRVSRQAPRASVLFNRPAEGTLAGISGCWATTGIWTSECWRYELLIALILTKLLPTIAQSVPDGSALRLFLGNGWVYAQTSGDFCGHILLQASRGDGKTFQSCRESCLHLLGFTPKVLVMVTLWTLPPALHHRLCRPYDDDFPFIELLELSYSSVKLWGASQIRRRCRMPSVGSAGSQYLSSSVCTPTSLPQHSITGML